MKLGKVIGQVVSTRKDERLVGHKLLLVQFLEPGKDGRLVSARGDGRVEVSVDLVGAGVGETVLLCSGSSARNATGVTDAPIDFAIVGIVDTADVFLDELT
ncbi:MULTISPECIES: EutN/CcmL family microcompartment protein [Acetomicrobium]|jgi:ethanolamine utilization protein EutN|uniref:EutN/CcmL family microcompartment protein n=1 Tax=Acetomicrobium TaxID=49894 RepID=UPI0026EE96F9|nr:MULTISPECIES: EutN/CcmL family microcompartment protein [Acetomicrobium]MDI9377195.1 EutN/CcmL family microcompartment protein [Synergistota bacterium]MDR9771060.1 EutN/CcmL family microcompartment protein [Acetomicrobium sp.]HPU69425.1 EutN/CcmL family microcompartment protein [Acetomicrobium flavidum]